MLPQSLPPTESESGRSVTMTNVFQHNIVDAGITWRYYNTLVLFGGEEKTRLDVDQDERASKSH